MSSTISTATGTAHQNSSDRVSANEQRDLSNMSSLSGFASTAPTSPDRADDLERTVSPVHTTSIHAIVTQTQSRSVSLQILNHSSNSHISHCVLSNVGGDATTTNNHNNHHYHINISGPTTLRCHPDHIHPVLEVGAADNLEQDPESVRRRLVERAQDIPPELKHAQAQGLEGLLRRRSVGEVPGNAERIGEETPSFADWVDHFVHAQGTKSRCALIDNLNVMYFNRAKDMIKVPDWDVTNVFLKRTPTILFSLERLNLIATTTDLKPSWM
ncbi:hypothetical protein D9758_009689 [Tetrapyrgos nigripes]|uniref:Uncharacterized protein n=1 Tax=Tetrapyrgos nigripes TaxID=182062 RepID=A0A8H5CQD9_9AGAR|nr:hypothetical protein D9758_009689 [Tetrapyrgos nigripes]